MHFNLVVGSYLFYLLLIFFAIKRRTQTNKHRHCHCSKRSSVVPLPEKTTQSKEETKKIVQFPEVSLDVCIRFTYTMFECKALPDYGIVQTKSVCVLVVICIQIFIWFFFLCCLFVMSIVCSASSFWPCHSRREKEKQMTRTTEQNRPTKICQCWW